MVVTFVLIFTAMADPPGPDTDKLAAVSVDASGASSKVMVMGVVVLTHVAPAAGTTELIEIGEVSVDERVSNV